MMPTKHPRTMQEAFGPYTSHEIQDDADRIGRQTRRGDRIADGVILALAVIVMCAWAWGWL